MNLMPKDVVISFLFFSFYGAGESGSDLFYIATDSGEGLLVFGMTVDSHLTFNLPTCSTDKSTYTPC